MRNIEEKFSLRFKKLRRAMGLTQEEFIKKFNKEFNRSFTAAAISQYENGKRIPEIDALIDFANFFGVPVDYLLGVNDTSTEEERKFAEVAKAVKDSEERSRQETVSKLKKYLTYDEKEKPTNEGELEKDVVIYHRDGKTVRRKFTKAQLAMISAMLDAIPDETDENSEL